MNPHDPVKQPGAQLAAETFNVEDPWTLSGRHPLRDLLDVIGSMVAEAARGVDELHGELTRLAQSAIAPPEPVGRRSHGVLRTTGPQIELLAASREAAYEQLVRAVSAYQRLLPEPATPSAPTALARNLGPIPEQEPERDDDLAISGDRRLVALRAVEQGSLRLCQSALCEQDRYLSDGSGHAVGVWTQTVERMLSDGLLEKDTSTSPYRPGQLLSLTRKGEAALLAARVAEPRVSAALRRSHPASAPAGAAPDSAPSAPAGPGTKASRSR